VLNADNNDPMNSTVNRERAATPASALAPISDWSDMTESDHFVQFYEDDEFLLRSLSGYVGMGLSLGDACIVVATRAHRESLDQRLQGYGLDVFAARAAGQYLPLDADETLSQLTVDGKVDAGRFEELVGGLITRAAQGGRHVRVFGEMVALLWQRGEAGAAIQLEGCWNELRAVGAFTLFCAYPMQACAGEGLADSFNSVCATHSRVIPAESYVGLSSTDERLRAIIRLQQKAASLEAQITERKEAEAELIKMKDKLETQVAEAEAANRMKDQFLSTVSHELRTPLNAILGWVHMLRRSELDEATVASALETIERNARAQAQLVNDILDMSRVITGRLRLNVGPVDMAAVINQAIDSVQVAADSKNIRLGVILDPTARHLSGDASRLQQAIWNLLSNAIKFTPSGGRVEVRLERDGADALIQVSDTGEGISREVIPFIFDRFRQADGTISRRHGGLGLGLAIVRHLIEMHGGTAEVESAGEGCGATFTLRLPLTPARASAKA
jgi:signal transduction histidine kinase